MSVDASVAELSRTVCALREEVDRLAQRVVALESAAAPGEAAVAQPVPAEPEELSEELVLVISAAIAAFLGKKPHIRQIRLVASPTWTHQGRVSIQASHALTVRSRTGATL